MEIIRRDPNTLRHVDVSLPKRNEEVPNSLPVATDIIPEVKFSQAAQSQNYLPQQESLSSMVPVAQTQHNVPTLSAMSQMSNPFAMDAYRNFQMPNIPLPAPQGMAETLLADHNIPDNFREKFWFVFNRDTVLTFTDEERKYMNMLAFDIAKIDVLNETPYYQYSNKLETEFNLARNIYETKLNRSLGFKGASAKNERTVLQSQFSESKSITEDNGGAQVRDGFFKRLLGKR